MNKIAHRCSRCQGLAIISEAGLNGFIVTANQLPMEHFCPDGGTGLLAEMVSITVEPKVKCWGC